MIGTILKLTGILKNVGASRAYYTCEKIYEEYCKASEENIFDGWSLYSTLIEFLIQFLFFLEFELKNLDEKIQ